MECKRAANTDNMNNHLERMGVNHSNGALLASTGCRIVSWKKGTGEGIEVARKHIHEKERDMLQSARKAQKRGSLCTRVDWSQGKR